MSKYLYGENYHNVDAKGRLSIPAKFRDELGYDLILAYGPEEFLMLYSREEWDKLVESIAEKVDTSTAEGRKFMKRFTAKVAACDVDSQGRIIIPQQMRDYAHITREVVVSGNMLRAEIWDKARYVELFGGNEEGNMIDNEEMSESLADGIAKFNIQL